MINKCKLAMVTGITGQDGSYLTEHLLSKGYKMFEHVGLDYENHVEIDSKFFRPHEVPILLGDATKAKENLGWQPKIIFKDLAKMMYDSDLNKIKGEMR